MTGGAAPDAPTAGTACRIHASLPTSPLRPRRSPVRDCTSCPGRRARGPVKRLAHLLAVLAVTVAALLYALWGVDFGRLGELLVRADYRLLAPFEACLVGFYLFNSLRWNLILRSLGRYTLAQSAPAMMIGYAGNNVLPAHLGELVRAVVFGRQFGRSATAVFMTLVVERILDVLAILLFYFLAVLLIHPFPAQIRLGAQVVALIVGVACLGIVVFLRYPQAFERGWERCSGRLPAAIRARGTALLHHAVLGLASLKSPLMLGRMVAHSLLKWAACGGMIWLSLRAFGGSISFSVSMIVIAVMALALTAPSAPGFVGAIQAAFVFALGPFGVPQETALAASVFYLVAEWLPVTLVGGICFVATGLQLREVRAEAERLEGQTSA